MTNNRVAQKVAALLGVLLVVALFSTVQAAENDVILTAGQPVYTKDGFVVRVDIQFYNKARYNDQVLLSYHICAEDGSILIAENQRIAFELDEKGMATVKMTVNCANLPEMAGLDRAFVQLDMVDQKNAFWFSANEAIGFQADSIAFDRSLLSTLDYSDMEENENTATTEAPLPSAKSTIFSSLCCLVGWAVVLCTLLLYRANQKGDSGR